MCTPEVTAETSASRAVLEYGKVVKKAFQDSFAEKNRRPRKRICFLPSKLVQKFFDKWATTIVGSTPESSGLKNIINFIKSCFLLERKGSHAVAPRERPRGFWPREPWFALPVNTGRRRDALEVVEGTWWM